MKINLIQNEIETAIEQYVRDFVSLPATKYFKIEMIATRGSTGITAEISIEDALSDDPITSETKVEEPVEEKKEEVTPITETVTETPKKSFFANLA